MKLLIALVLSALFIALLRKPLKKYPALFYIITVILAVYTALGSFTWMPSWCRNYILALFQRGALSTALFTVVMYIGTLKNGSSLMKKLMPVRGELSIIACILALCHNVFYGQTYFKYLFTKPEALSSTQIIAACISIVLICLMLPLMVTSFMTVRRKMKAKNWKCLQRLAYPFYMLIYVHVMLLTLPSALGGKREFILNTVIYSLIFIGYAVLRLRKYFAKRSSK